MTSTSQELTYTCLVRNFTGFSRKCQCTLSSRQGTCTSSSKFIIHSNDNQFNDKFTCKMHLRKCYSQHQQQNISIIKFTLSKRVNDNQTITLTSTNSNLIQTITTNINEIENVNQPNFTFTNPSSNYDSFITPPHTPVQNQPTTPPPLNVTRTMYDTQNLQRSNASNEYTPLTRTDFVSFNHSQPTNNTFLQRLNSVANDRNIRGIIDVKNDIRSLINTNGLKLKTPTSSECSICLSNNINHRNGGSIRCGHSFHTTCISRWFNTNTRFTCPCCRASADILDLIS